MEIAIVDNESGREIAHYTINLGGLNYTPTEDEYYSEAWKCAVEDEVVDSDNRDKYSFRIGVV